MQKGPSTRTALSVVIESINDLRDSRSYGRDRDRRMTAVDPA